MKQTAEVVAMRLKEIDEGTLLYLWIRAYVEYARKQSGRSMHFEEGL